MTSPPKQLGWIVHVIVWIVLIFFPFLFRGRDNGTISLHDYLRFFIVLAGMLVVFYVNFSFLVQRFLFTRRFWTYLICILILFATVITVSHVIMNFIPSPEYIHPEREYRAPGHLIFLFEFVKYIFLTAISVALKVTSSWLKMDTERKELEKQRSDAELQNLKNQLNPHFLFNTLNNIYCLIAMNGDQAQEAVHVLSRLLRYILYDSAQTFVTLGKDVDFVKNYVELMRIRMPQNVDLNTVFKIEKPEMLIAPLLFISLAENAFKHGVSNSKPSFIHLLFIADDKSVHCTIKNSFFPKDKQDKSGSGIGLLNLKKRLDLLYHENYTLTCKQSDDVYSCDLLLNL